MDEERNRGRKEQKKGLENDQLLGEQNSSLLLVTGFNLYSTYLLV